MSAHCARHIEVEATGTCARCGDYVCDGCRHPHHEEHCQGCGDRFAHGIAFEDRRFGSVPWRALLTSRQVLLTPQVAFPGPSRVGPALTFAALNACAVGLALFIVCLIFVAKVDLPISPTFGEEGPIVLGVASALVGVGAGVLVLVMTLGMGWSFAIGLSGVGRPRGALRFGIRAAGYAAGVVALSLGAIVATAPLSLVVDPSLFDWVRWFWVAMGLVWPALTGRVFFHAARGLGLPSARAATAALGPTVLCTLPAAWWSHHQLSLIGF